MGVCAHEAEHGSGARRSGEDPGPLISRLDLSAAASQNRALSSQTQSREPHWMLPTCERALCMWRAARQASGEACVASGVKVGSSGRAFPRLKAIVPPFTGHPTPAMALLRILSVVGALSLVSGRTIVHSSGELVLQAPDGRPRLDDGR
jgi:hypothetical protein